MMFTKLSKKKNRGVHEMVKKVDRSGGNQTIIFGLRLKKNKTFCYCGTEKKNWGGGK